MNARLYERVSTDRQATEGFSLEAQHERLVAYCVSQGWSIAGRYVDDGESGKDLDRPEVQRMLKESQAGDIILVYRLDRLTRSSKDIEYLLELAEEKQIYLKSATEDINTQSSSGRFHLRLIVQFGQYERETIAERASMGKRRRVKEGNWQGGKPPFGYITVDSNEVKNGRYLKRLEPNPMNAHLVPAIFDRYLKGEGTRAIAKWLNDELQVRTVGGALFSSTMVSRIIKNPIYCGEGTYNRTKPKRGETVERVPIDVPPLIKTLVYQQAQSALQRRTRYAPRQATGNFPLSGIAVCGNCGSYLFGSKVTNGATRHTGKSWRGYRCANYAKGRHCGDPPFVTVSATVVEDNLLDLLDEKSTTEEFDAFFERCIAEAGAVNQDNQAEAERLREEMKEAQRAKERWDAKFEKGNMEEEEHEAMTKPHRERLKALKVRLTELEAIIVKLPDKEEMRIAFRNVWRSWHGLTLPEQKALLQSFVEFVPVLIVVHPGREVELRPRRLVAHQSPIA